MNIAEKFEIWKAADTRYSVLKSQDSLESFKILNDKKIILLLIVPCVLKITWILSICRNEI